MSHFLVEAHHLFVVIRTGLLLETELRIPDNTSIRKAPGITHKVLRHLLSNLFSGLVTQMGN